MLRKLYTCLRVAASAKAGRKLLKRDLPGMKILVRPLAREDDMTRKILTIRLIKLWKHPCRTIAVGN
jgi:hypothetical protein